MDPCNWLVLDWQISRSERPLAVIGVDGAALVGR
jgi:hypothetical protein